MKKLLLALLAAVGVIASSAPTVANCPGPFCQPVGPRLPFFRQTPVPAFQAAPWYLYFPYNAHFQTPAPMHGAFYAPPGGGYGGLQNPYFPAQMPTAMPSR